MKTDVYVGFRDTRKIVEAIDKIAADNGLNRSNYLRKMMREEIDKAAKERGINRSAFIRQSLRRELKKEARER